jgi:hypothetical protein
MTRLTKKQRQQLFLEEFLRRTREARPGERVYAAVGDLFEAAEVHDLEEERPLAVRRRIAAVTMRGRMVHEI